MKRRSGGSSKKKKRKEKQKKRRAERENNTFGETEEPIVFEDPFVDEYEEEDVAPTIRTTVKGAQGEDDNVDAEKQMWDPLDRPLEDGETLNYDSSAYSMFHSMRPEWPCLSFDVVKDNLGAKRTKFPLTAFIVSGSQADRSDRNKLTVMKVSDMHKTQHDEDDEDDEDDVGLDDDPIVQTKANVS